MAMPNAAAIQKLSGDNWDEWHFEVKNALACAGLGAALRVTAPGGPGERRSGAGSLGSGSGAAAGTSPISVAAEAAADALHAAAAAATPTASAAAASARALPVDVDERAHAFICSTVNVRKYRGLCERHTTARGLWEALRDMHVSKVLASRSLLVRQAASLRMSKEESVQDYWARAEDLHEQLNLTEPYGETLTQALEGLPAGFDIVVNEVLRKPVASVAFQGLAVSDAMSVVSKPLLRGEWLVDSGCSRHLTPHRDILQGYEPLPVPHTIICGNGSTMAATGQGSVQFRGAGGELTLLNVLHVPAADGSLVSVGKATRAGGVVHFTPHGCCINMPGTGCSITARQVEEDLFLLDSQPVRAADSFSMAARICDDPLTLHHRLGQKKKKKKTTPAWSRRALRKELPPGARPAPTTYPGVKAAHCEAAADSGNLCEPCVLAKQHRLVAVQHQGLGGAVKHPLELVHSDVCDISGHADAAVPAPSGMRYFVTVLDEYSSLVAVVLIKHKSDAPAAIIDMLTQLHRQTGRRVVALRSDRGGEYMGAEMQQWLRAQGITHQQTAPYSPEMNGSAERINRTLMACARAIVFASGAPKHLCGEAIRAAAHLHNITPVAEKPCTPFEAAFGSKPDIAHLQVWGCPAYVHDPAPDGKLASRSIKGLFVGYEPGGKAYRVWAEGRIHVSKSVVFDEQAVLRRYAPTPVSGPAALSAPPEGEASKGGQAPPLLRRGERVRKAVRFADYVTVCYSARNVSCNISEGVGSSGRRERVALVGSRAAAIGFSTKRRFSKAVSRPEAEEWGRAVDAKMARVQLLPAAASLWHEAGYGPTHFNVRESRYLSDGVHQAVPRKSRLVSAPASREGMAMPNAAAIQKLSGDNWDEWHFEVKNALACAGLGAALRVTAPGGPGERRSGAGSLGSGSGAAAGTSPISVAAEAAADALHAAAAAATPTASAAAASARALPVDVDERAHAFICSTVNVRKYRGLCERHTTARGLWEALRDMHVSKVLASRSLLVRQAASLRMSKEESVQDYWARAEDLHEQLNLTEPYGETLTQALEGLPAGFDIVVNEVLRKPVASRPTFVEVLPLLLVQERVLTRRQPAAIALSARPGGSRGRASSRGRGQGRGGGAERGQGRSGGVGGSGFQGECYKCLQWGHQAHQCPNRPRSPSPSPRGHSPATYSGGASRPPTPGSGGGRAPAWGGSSSGRGRDPSPSASRYPASTSRSSVAFQGLAVSDAMSVVSKPLLRGEWLVDSGCSRHLTPHRDILQGYEPLPVPHTIICGNGSTMAATGQGSVQFRGAGGELTLLNVLHVPAADGSLVSVGKATRAGGVVHFTPHGCCINMPGTGCSITARQVEEDLFLLDSQPVRAADSFSMAARICDDPLTLHHRLGQKKKKKKTTSQVQQPRLYLCKVFSS
ncbi:hypothetical protein QJQ45_022871 [Haematococcus lacustris]|nr:hypothetical protein QJQ45_022871 [Haematococcus lacustris]